jgi:uncharacterized protein
MIERGIERIDVEPRLRGGFAKPRNQRRHQKVVQIIRGGKPKRTPRHSRIETAMLRRHEIQHVLGITLLVTSMALVFRPQLAKLAVRKPRTVSPAHTVLYTSIDRRGARRAGFADLGRGRRNRRDGLTAALPGACHFSHRRCGYRPCGAAYAPRGHGALAARVSRRQHADLALDRLRSGNALGSHFSARSPEALLRNLLTAALVLVGVRLLWA